MRSDSRAIAICWSTHTVRIKQTTLLVSALLIWWLAASVGQLWGQEYKTLPINPDFDLRVDPDAPRDRREESARRQRFGERVRLINDIFKGDAGLADNQAAFDQWFNEVIFAQMAQDTDDVLAQIAENRAQMFKQLSSAANPQAVDRLVRVLALPKMQEIASDNFHPASRLNAVIILGRLDTTVGVSRRVAPQPLQDALPVLLQYLQDGSLPEYVRVGALWGIERHCRIDGQKEDANAQIDAALRGQLVAALLPVLGEAPEGLDPSIDYWMKRTATRALGGLRELGNNNEVATTLLATMENSDAPITLRCEAARSYGGLRFNDAAAAQAAKISGVISKLGAIAAQHELDYLDDEEQRMKDVARYKSGAVGGAGSSAMTLRPPR